MTEVLDEVLNDISTFAPQHFGNMTVIGLNIPENRDVDLMSLKKGLELGLVEISEVDEGGSVGEVRVINNAVTPLLILDGEEIIGAKQNRIANATIIIEAKSEKIIPVSCTEAGRWHYNSQHFASSRHMASSLVRRDKSSSVYNSLKSRRGYKSDQQKVWNNIATTEHNLSCESPTNSLNDVYREKTYDIDKYRDAFKIQENQNGFIVYINGRLVGLEMIYNSDRYKEYHDRLVESYIIDAMRKQDEEVKNVDESSEDFLEDIRKSNLESYDSVGLGIDYRVDDEDITGSAVVFDETLINASFFKKRDESLEADI